MRFLSKNLGFRSFLGPKLIRQKIKSKIKVYFGKIVQISSHNPYTVPEIFCT